VTVVTLAPGHTQLDPASASPPQEILKSQYLSLLTTRESLYKVIFRICAWKPVASTSLSQNLATQSACLRHRLRSTGGAFECRTSRFRAPRRVPDDRPPVYMYIHIHPPINQYSNNNFCVVSVLCLCCVCVGCVWTTHAWGEVVEAPRWGIDGLGFRVSAPRGASTEDLWPKAIPHVCVHICTHYIYTFVQTHI
jgi:hypothetical protein